MMQLFIPHLEQHSVSQLPFSRRLVPVSESVTASVYKPDPGGAL